MSLLAAFLDIVEDWRAVFPQQRTFQRGVRQALGSLACLGRRCLSRIIWTNGGQQRSWSAEYFLHSRCRWEPQQLFQPILKRALAYCPQRLVGVAMDDTRLKKTGRSIEQAFYQRDPLSPPFHVNLVLGLRFLQASLLVPLHHKRPMCARFEVCEILHVARPDQAISSPARYSEIERECRLSFAPLQRAMDSRYQKAVMSVTLAATRHSSLSNGRSVLKQEVKSLCLKVRNPAEK